MLSRPDFLEKQIIVIHSYQLRGLRFANENLIIEEDGVVIEQTTLHKIFAVFLIGEATISTKLIEKLKSFGILLILMKKNLSLIDVIGDDPNGNTLLREKQYEKFEGEEANTLARVCITNKILNQEALLRKLRAKSEIEKDTANKLHTLAGSAKLCQKSEKLLGIEGNAAKYFFHEYYREMDWMGRYPRTRIDRNNLLLDIGYTFLFHFIEALLCLYGFDLYK
jgi:CRISPR-associated protein Cas1